MDKTLCRIGLVLALAAGAWAQTPAVQSATGTVTRIDAASRSLTVKTDAGQEFSVTLEPRASIRRIAPGETDLTKAAIIQINEVSVGDRVQARGKIENQSVAATLLWVMTQGDVAKQQAAEQADWDKRGVSGLVTAVAPDSITVSVRNLAGVKPVVITPAANAIVRRYAPDSVNFVDAKPSTLAEIKTGDQVRARGEKNEDGSKMAAQEIVSGAFKTTAGVVLSIDAANRQMQVRDLDTKKPVTVVINKDSSMLKLNPQLAQTIAARLHPEAAPARGGEGGGRGRGAREGGFGRGGGGGRGNADLQQMIDSSPAITLTDLKNGDAIVVSSTVGATAGKITAIKLLAGVEPILTKPGTQEMSLGSWSLDIGGGLGGP